MDIEAYLELLARAQTVFDLRRLAEGGEDVGAGLCQGIDPTRLAPRGLERARDNLLSLCGREIGRFAVDTVTAYVAFSMALLARDPVWAGIAPQLASRFEANRLAYLHGLEGGDRDSLPAWKFLGALYRLDPGIDRAFEPELLPPYRVCRDLTALRLEPRARSGPVEPLHVLGLVAFAEVFSVFRLPFDAFVRLLDRHGRPSRREASLMAPEFAAGGPTRGAGVSVWN